MSAQNWKLDGEKVVPNHQASVSWENGTFFTNSYKGENYHGEILEEKLEDRKLRVKINHREFLIEKDLAVSLERDAQRSNSSNTGYYEPNRLRAESINVSFHHYVIGACRCRCNF